METIRIKLSNRIYDKSSILQAILDYREAAEGTIVDDAFTVELTPNDEHKNLKIKEEFCNYVLGLMKNNGTI